MSTDARPSAEMKDRAQPETFRARSLSASLTANDLEKSVAWYRDVLGFTVGQRYEREGRLMAVAMKAGAVSILISQDDGTKGLDRVKGQGISLMFTTAQSIDQLASRVRESGVMFDTEPSDTPWGARMFRLRDPDGFKLTISSER
jgi:uncharacterized glyoxalase superfamily protein PhnB